MVATVLLCPEMSCYFANVLKCPEMSWYLMYFLKDVLKCPDFWYVSLPRKIIMLIFIFDPENSEMSAS